MEPGLARLSCCAHLPVVLHFCRSLRLLFQKVHSCAEVELFPYTVHSALRILHSLHSRLDLHSPLYTPHSPLGMHTRHFDSELTLHVTVYILNFTLRTLHSRLYRTLHPTLPTPRFTLYTWHSILLLHVALTLEATFVFHAHDPAKLAFVPYPWSSSFQEQVCKQGSQAMFPGRGSKGSQEHVPKTGSKQGSQQ